MTYYQFLRDDGAWGRLNPIPPRGSEDRGTIGWSYHNGRARIVEIDDGPDPHAEHLMRQRCVRQIMDAYQAGMIDGDQTDKLLAAVDKF